jgi:hypothetical protein
MFITSDHNLFFYNIFMSQEIQFADYIFPAFDQIVNEAGNKISSIFYFMFP